VLLSSLTLLSFSLLPCHHKNWRKKPPYSFSPSCSSLSHCFSLSRAASLSQPCHRKIEGRSFHRSKMEDGSSSEQQDFVIVSENLSLFCSTLRLHCCWDFSALKMMKFNNRFLEYNSSSFFIMLSNCMLVIFVLKVFLCFD
jgi:hypothetical protein